MTKIKVYEFTLPRVLCLNNFYCKNCRICLFEKWLFLGLKIIQVTDLLGHPHCIYTAFVSRFHSSVPFLRFWKCRMQARDLRTIWLYEFQAALDPTRNSWEINIAFGQVSVTKRIIQRCFERFRNGDEGYEAWGRFRPCWLFE